MANYFHISQHKLPVGTELSAKGVPHVQEEIETILEKSRPGENLSRADAVYMLDHTDFSKCGVSYRQGYIHVVAPVGTVHKHDSHWIGRMQRRRIYEKHARSASAPRDLPDKDLAAGYWSGRPSSEPSWEYLAASARVVKYHCEEMVETGRSLPLAP